MGFPAFPSDAARTPEGVARLRESYAEHGFVVIREVISKPALSALKTQLFEAFEQAQRQDGLFDGGGLMAGHINCYPGEPSRFAFDALEEAGIRGLIRTVSEQFASAPRAGCNMNLPDSVAQNWHIDGTFERDFMIANVAVVDTDLVNGAIDLLPRSHTTPEPYWRMELERRFRQHQRVEMQQGDVLVRSSRLWHRGMPNRARVARPMLGFTFGEDVAPPGDPFAANSGRIAFSPNRFRTDLLGKLRERSYVAAPFAHTAFRLIRSFLGKDGYA